RVTVPRRHTPVSFAPYPLAPTERMVVTRETGEPTVLLAHGTSVLRVATEPAEPSEPSTDEGALVGTTPDHRVLFKGGRVRVLERGTDREVAALALPQGAAPGITDEKRLWVLHPVGGGAIDMSAYELPALRRLVGFRLPARSDAPPLQGDLRGPVSYVRERVDGRERLLFFSDGMLSSWDAATGEPLSEPVPVGGTDAVRAYRLEAHLHDRPGPPGQDAVALHDRTVELWDVPSGRLLGTIPTQLNTDLTRLGYDVLAFDPTGTRIVTLAAGRTIQVWDLDAAAPARPPIAAPRVDEIAGFDAEGHLVVLDRSDSDPTLITI